MKIKKCGKMVISLDFELQYGMEDVSALSSYKKNIVGVRRVVPELLKQFEKYNMHATWAIVGMMLAEDKEDLYSYMPEKKPRYLNRALSIYENIDKIGINEKEDPFHFALDLVKLIGSTANQEIASHTFCHYYCLEKGQTNLTFDEDLKSAVKIIKEKTKTTCKSLVLPRNQINPSYIENIKQNGIIAYRGCPNYFVYKSSHNNYLIRAIRLLDAYINILGKKCYPIESIENNGICDIKASSFFRPYNYKFRVFEKIKMRRIKLQMQYAAEKGMIFHLWWHPHNFGINTNQNLKELKEILDYFVILKQSYGFESKTMREISEEIIGR